MVIMHCTAPTEVFQHISDSGPVRKGDLLVMMDPRFKKALDDEHIVLTTWREVMEKEAKCSNIISVKKKPSVLKAFVLTAQSLTAQLMNHDLQAGVLFALLFA